jgi:glycosyltransferase involved in cell wall biosynthesis
VNILLESRAFYPSVGGLEMMAQELGRTWQNRGHTIRIATATPLNGEAELADLEVVRLPSPSEWMRQMQWADVFFQNGVSLRSLGYAVLTGCPIVFRHPDVLRPIDDGFDLRNELKRWATTLGKNVASCEAVAEPIRGETVTVPNTVRPIFQNQLAVEDKEESRTGLLFVGRMVSIKGVDVAIQALRILRERGIKQSLTLCGDGPERKAVEEQVEEYGLTDAVAFEGWTDPEDLVRHYSAAEVTLVPSRYEPFGIVALEAIACGCPVVASNVDGLPEAVGDCGLLVPPDDPDTLADTIERALRSDVRRALQSAMPAHVDRHRIDRISTDYLHLLRRVVRGR